MNTEKIFTIYDTRLNTKKVIKSSATTLGELKTDLVAAGINTDNMQIQEGLTNTMLLNDNTVLPHDVPYMGSTTNNLVFRITHINSKIPSGAGDRRSVYAVIEKDGLAQAIKAVFGKPFTNLATEVLENFINNNKKANVSCSTSNSGEYDAVLSYLFENDLITLAQFKEASDANWKLNYCHCKTQKDEVPNVYSDEELENILNNIG